MEQAEETLLHFRLPLPLPVHTGKNQMK